MVAAVLRAVVEVPLDEARERALFVPRERLLRLRVSQFAVADGAAEAQVRVQAL